MPQSSNEYLHQRRNNIFTGIQSTDSNSLPFILLAINQNWEYSFVGGHQNVRNYQIATKDRRVIHHKWTLDRWPRCGCEWVIRWSTLNSRETRTLTHELTASKTKRYINLRLPFGSWGWEDFLEFLHPPAPSTSFQWKYFGIFLHERMFYICVQSILCYMQTSAKNCLGYSLSVWIEQLQFLWSAFGVIHHGLHQSFKAWNILKYCHWVYIKACQPVLL